MCGQVLFEKLLLRGGVAIEAGSSIEDVVFLLPFEMEKVVIARKKIIVNFARQKRCKTRLSRSCTGELGQIGKRGAYR